MTNINEIIDFVKYSTNTSKNIILPSTALQNDLGIYGDDMDEILQEYSKRFNVDMSAYRWYFHTGEEGTSTGAVFFKPPNSRVDEIPITINMLLEFAIRGKWATPYPQHKIPMYRIDIWIGGIISVALLIGILIVLYFKFFGS